MQTKYKNRMNSDEEPTSLRIKQLLELMPTLKRYVPEILTFNSTLSLLDFYQKSKTKQTSNLFSEIELPKEIQDQSLTADIIYYPHLKQEINLH